MFFFTLQKKHKSFFLAEMGSLSPKQILAAIQQLLAFHRLNHAESNFVMLRAPTFSNRELQISKAILGLFNFNFC